MVLFPNKWHNYPSSCSNPKPRNHPYPPLFYQYAHRLHHHLLQILPSKHPSNRFTSSCLHHEHQFMTPALRLTIISMLYSVFCSLPHSTHFPLQPELSCNSSLKIFCWLPSALQINRRILNVAYKGQDNQNPVNWHDKRAPSIISEYYDVF